MGKINIDVKNGFLRIYPDVERIILPFTSHFNVNHAKNVNIYGTQIYCILLSPDKDMKDIFGFSDELLLVYSPYDSIQPRTIQAIEAAFTQPPYSVRANPLVFFLVTHDKNGENWLERYLIDHPQFRTPIVLDIDSLEDNKLDRWFLRNKMANILYARDIFDYQLPLDKDMYFFGRGNTVGNFLDSVKKSQNRGLFGLRKTGKTSILYKIKRSISENNIGYCVYLDCKIKTIRSLSCDGLLNYICDALSKEAKRRPARSDEDAVERLKKTISSLGGKNICIIFDEIEFISPIAIQNPHWKNDFIDFWQVMWSIQSEIRRISFIVAGVNPYVTEVDLIGGVQNPMFGIVRAHMLTGLDRSETKAMVDRIGKQMGMFFDDGATDYLFHRYGGHPLLTRMACSFTNQGLISREQKRPVQITEKLLKSEEAKRDGELQFYCRHIVSELNEFYPEEYEILKMLAIGQIADFYEFAAQPEWITHVSGYGVLQNVVGGRPTFKIPVLQRYIANEYARQNGTPEPRAIIPVGERGAWLLRRKNSIIGELRTFLRQVVEKGLDSPFGNHLLPESHRISELKVVIDWLSFGEFITNLNICLNETIDDIKGKGYFFGDLKTKYMTLFNSLNRIRVYRNNENHLRLNNKIDRVLQQYLDIDLMGSPISSYSEPWFLMQQVCLDELFVAIQVEINKLS